MVLNAIFILFFLAAYGAALVKLIAFHDTGVFTALVNSTFDSAKTGFEVSLGLSGVLTLWMGLMKVGEAGGVVAVFAKLVEPLFSRIFPGIPKGHPAAGSLMMNFAANMLGLDNAATPMGLKAMREMQELNRDKETASDSQIMFLVLNTAGHTVIPVNIMVYRAQMGAKNPSDVFLPLLLATSVASLAGLIAVALYQRLNLLNRVVVAYLGGLAAALGLLVWWLRSLGPERMATASTLIANVFLFSLIVLFLVLAWRKRVNVYETFIDGAKEGFATAVRIIPYLVAILVAIGCFRASGCMDWLVGGVRRLAALAHLDTRFVDALPVAFMKPLSGSGARGMMVDAMKTFGADSFAGRLACTFQGATDTTFFILAVYFGAVGVKRTRYAVACGLVADLAGALAAIGAAYLFFG